jgi:hypothetical protein
MLYRKLSGVSDGRIRALRIHSVRFAHPDLHRTEKAARGYQYHRASQIFGGQAMNTGQITADYHLYKRQLDEAKKRIAELEQALHPIANSYTDCEITDRPAWWILCPSQNMKKSAHETYASFFGPFWSRESAAKYLAGRRHHFADNAIVYCGSCNDSPELKKLFDLSKVIGGKQ